jgi:hypothetical protein
MPDLTCRACATQGRSSELQPIPQLSIIENAELPLVYAGVLREERHQAQEMLAAVGLAQRGHTFGAPAASASARHRPRSSTRRRWCSVVAAPGSNHEDLRRLHAGGTTIVTVTHDPEVARSSASSRCGDGLIEATPVSGPDSTPGSARVA